jgi:hypothetical protein
MVELGTAEYTYEIAEGWGKLPDGWSFKEAAAVGVDSKDNVYVFNRGEHPVIIFDREGNFLSSWGEGVFPRAHGVTMGPDDTIFLTDDGDHTMRHCTLDGKVLMTLGISGKPAPFMSGDPFNRCTHLAIDPSNGDFFISDGYGNARVHKYSPDGKLLLSWGESGTGPGQFNIAHNIATDKDGWVYVADRENQRIQVFDRNGKYETQWNDMARPCGMFIDTSGEQRVYVGELGNYIGPNSQAHGLGPRISIMDIKGNVLARLGDRPEGLDVGQFMAPHGVSIDSHGDIYVGEVAWTHTRSYANPPDEIRSLQKLVRKG